MSFQTVVRQYRHRLVKDVKATFSLPRTVGTPKRGARASTSASAAGAGARSAGKKQTLFEWYSEKLETHPLITKGITAGFISSTGNLLAQRIAHEKEKAGTLEEQEHAAKDPSHPQHRQMAMQEGEFEIDWAKTGRFAFLNVVLVAPVLHYWYQFINRSVPGSSLTRVLQRVFWDEFVFTPLYLPVVLGSLWTLEGTSPPKVWEMIKSETMKLVMAEWVVWVPTMFLTFRYVPVKFQVLTINLVGVFWNTYLSFMVSEAHKTTSTDKVATETDTHTATTVPTSTSHNHGHGHNHGHNHTHDNNTHLVSKVMAVARADTARVAALKEKN
uniref:Peroxisomal membrane protein MPV17 n=1 Tax=Craspedostauros australis TaxID=1486917 RepID=A0A7R9WT51_9STRA|mmetsp:Transcript_1950/g.5378  ORF Transcript_1950/g.5378 Transcript_1950/m.5378 type:complete len:328 (+) Transcript_1950:320-1303(+)|eukprot:CAMPEP_0198135952 /NCGR_PEP_ID=MMETSP1442-20131203/60858_1 /TAXON_ID= /ORGANISM="Craspedostauros australis, Strain CCMP3328" /LENGTH=327 /DNA_ID=CAMNT_0043797145 /DNA_START=310 /DNA_END=1293 /DNA_ORIENTATION=+